MQDGQKNNANYCEHINHIQIHAKSKIITKYKVTSANVHDFYIIENLLNKHDKGKSFYADSAYTAKKQEDIIATKEMVNCIYENYIEQIH
jgi:IS5 family transposase